jgi:DNA mismatch repair protein MutS
MLLDPTAVATLELLETAHEHSSRGSLVAMLDRTTTPMGARLLRQWLLRPLLDVTEIGRRQDAVGALVEQPAVRATLRRRLQGVGDLERLASRAALGWPTRGILSDCEDSLAQLPVLREELAALDSAALPGRGRGHRVARRTAEAARRGARRRSPR